jgi:hypothetical protein
MKNCSFIVKFNEVQTLEQKLVALWVRGPFMSGCLEIVCILSEMEWRYNYQTNLGWTQSRADSTIFFSFVTHVYCILFSYYIWITCIFFFSVYPRSNSQWPYAPPPPGGAAGWARLLCGDAHPKGCGHCRLLWCPVHAGDTWKGRFVVQIYTVSVFL